MKKKILILIGLLFLLCGCTAEVNVEITGDKVNENISINAYPGGDYTMERLPKAFRQYVPAYAKDVLADAEPDEKKSGVAYYKRTQENIVDGYRFNYSYSYRINNYKDARSVKNGFRSSNIYEDKVAKTILFSTDNGGLLYFSDEYPLLTDVKIHIKTDKKVEEHNADYVNGNVYTWEFSKNGENKNIYLLLDKTTKNDSGNKEDEDDKNNPGENQTSSPTGNNKDNKTENDSKKQEYTSKVEESMNKHPFAYAIIAVFVFIFIVFILSKVTKITKVK